MVDQLLRKPSLILAKNIVSVRSLRKSEATRQIFGQCNLRIRFPYNYSLHYTQLLFCKSGKLVHSRRIWVRSPFRIFGYRDILYSILIWLIMKLLDTFSEGELLFFRPTLFDTNVYFILKTSDLAEAMTGREDGGCCLLRWRGRDLLSRRRRASRLPRHFPEDSFRSINTEY